VTKLSIIVPTFNEKTNILPVIKQLQDIPLEKEIVLVDDGSTDGTVNVIRTEVPDAGVKKIYNSANEGKGAAVRRGFKDCRGDYVVIQDADFEYNPDDLLRLLRYAEDKGAQVVYGSRFLGPARYPSFWHRTFHFLINRLVNVLYRTRLTDVETCYKLLSTDVFRKLDLSENGFNIDPQITTELIRLGYNIPEVPISYSPRTYSQGKKITWLDGIKAFLFFLTEKKKKRS